MVGTARRVWPLRVSNSLIANIRLRRLLALALLGALSLMASAACADGASTTAFAHLGPIVVHGNEADNLLLGAGLFDLRDDTSGAGTVEYRFGRKVFLVGFALGLMANTDGGLFGYVGAYADLSYKKFYVTPQLAMGGYGEGSSTDLGGVFQFRAVARSRLSLRQRSSPRNPGGPHIQRRHSRHQSRRGGAAADVLLSDRPLFVANVTEEGPIDLLSRRVHFRAPDQAMPRRIALAKQTRKLNERMTE